MSANKQLKICTKVSLTDFWGVQRFEVLFFFYSNKKKFSIILGKILPPLSLSLLTASQEAQSSIPKKAVRKTTGHARHAL